MIKNDNNVIFNLKSSRKLRTDEEVSLFSSLINELFGSGDNIDVLPILYHAFDDDNQKCLYSWVIEDLRSYEENFMKFGFDYVKTLLSSIDILLPHAQNYLKLFLYGCLYDNILYSSFKQILINEKDKFQKYEILRKIFDESDIEVSERASEILEILTVSPFV